MTGKTFFASKFPNPIILNTDGNGAKIDTPSVDIKDWGHFANVLSELMKGSHTFETIIIDLIEDIKLMLENYIIQEYNKKNEKNNKKAETLADFGFGIGYKQLDTKWLNFISILSRCKYNVIFISHNKEKIIDDNTFIVPALDTRFLNVLQGRSDVEINTSVIFGPFENKYIQRVLKTRAKYKKENIKDERILKVLEEVPNFFTVQPQAKPVQEKQETQKEQEKQETNKK